MKTWIWSDSLCRRENLCCLKGWIVLNPKLKISALLTDEKFFRTDSSSCLNSWIFFWTDYPSHSKGIPIDLERMTNSKRTIFSCSNWFLLVYIFVWGVIIKKRFKKKLRFTVEDLIVHSRMNSVTVSTWHDQSTWPASDVFGRSSHHSGRTLSVDRLLFWALNLQHCYKS